MKKLLLASLLSAAVPAMAVTLSAADLQGNAYTDYSADGLLSFDLDVFNNQASHFLLSFSADEVAAGSISFNAVVNNFIPGGIPSLHIQFAPLDVVAGSVQSGFNPGATGAFQTAANGASGNFFSWNPSVPVEHFGLLVGNPFGNNLTDWQISTVGLQAGTSYAFSVQAVPEPGSLALLLGALGIMGLARRRAV